MVSHISTLPTLIPQSWVASSSTIWKSTFLNRNHLGIFQSHVGTKPQTSFDENPFSYNFWSMHTIWVLFREKKKLDSMVKTMPAPPSLHELLLSTLVGVIMEDFSYASFCNNIYPIPASTPQCFPGRWGFRGDSLFPKYFVELSVQEA